MSVRCVPRYGYIDRSRDIKREVGMEGDSERGRGGGSMVEEGEE